MSEDWDWTCPLKQITVDVTDDRSTFISTVEPCGGVLHITWTVSWPVPTEPEDQRSFTREEVAAHAYTDSWEVVCEAGHVLAVHSRSSEDYAEPIDVPLVMESIGAIKQPIGAPLSLYRLLGSASDRSRQLGREF